MKSRPRAIIGGLLVGFLAGLGCRHVPEPEKTGHSSYTFVDQPVGPPPETKREALEPASRSNYFEAQLHEPAPLPVYPAQALKAQAKLSTVGVHIMVDPRGKVSDVRLSLLVFNTPGPFADDFRDAVEAAVRQWQFTPARAEYFEIVHEGSATYSRRTRVEQVETEFHLAFTFRPDGVVEAGGAK